VKVERLNIKVDDLEEIKSTSISNSLHNRLLRQQMERQGIEGIDPEEKE
jgi:hypothetical protein